MIIYATKCVKDEGDILDESIKKASLWVDKIFVIDNGSKDNTPDIIRKYYPRVIFLGSFYEEFQEGLNINTV